jgi:hypothetical protein
MILCDSWKTLKEKFLVNEQDLIKMGVNTAVIFGEFGYEFRGEGRSLH